MPYGKHFLILALGAVVLGMGASRALSADPPSEPLPAGGDPRDFGYSVPELTEAPVAEGATLAKPATFPYGAPLVDYEAARTCWPHHYCDCRYSTCKRRAQCRAWGYPEEFCERPFGTYVRSHLHRQVANGLADQMAVYHFDFYDTDTDQADQLKPRGVRQVNEVAKLTTMLYDQYFVVTIESTGNSELDNRRRLLVFEKLTDLGAPVGLDQIATGSPPAAGLDGVEAFEIYQKQLQQTKRQSGSSGGSSNTGVVSGGPNLRGRSR
jgi:hypothetical protein